MTMVDTIIGPIERDRLVVTDIVTEDDRSRAVATEWRLDGEIVKRDVWVCMLHGEAIFAERGIL